MHFISFWLYSLCSKLESIGHYLRRKQYHDYIPSSRNSETACCTVWHSCWKHRYKHFRVFTCRSEKWFIFGCQNFWNEAWWFLSLRVFRLLSSSLLLFPQCFGRYVQEPTWNSELHPLLNPWGSPVFIPSAITGFKCSCIDSQDWTCNLQMIVP